MFSTSEHQPKPSWLKVNIPASDQFHKLKKEMNQRGLATVCQEAKCPNISECWSDKTATIMILGDTCTRACKFCHVKTGNPKGLIDPMEIEHSVEMVKMMNLRYVVITSVDRDDLDDHGAGHFANVVSAIKIEQPDTKIEVLIPDFDSNKEYMHKLAQSKPFVIAQNLETVQRLTSSVRDKRAGYQKTLSALEFYSNNYPDIPTKSSIMLGLGESIEELLQAMKDLRNVGVKILTLGQYLQPTKRHLKVQKYFHPKEFEELKKQAYLLGFEFVASGPLVRSSYKAGDYLDFLEKSSYVQ